MSELLYEKETYAIRGAVFEVYSEMGSGFLEPVYQECLEKEFTSRAILYVAQGELRLTYKNEPLEQIYKPDFICFGMIIVELKAVRAGAGAQSPALELHESHPTEAGIARQLRMLSEGGNRKNGSLNSHLFRGLRFTNL
jgi:GxxExxY protein